MFVTKLAFGLLIGLVLLAPGEPEKRTTKSANDIAFEQLKKLAGDWRLANPKDEKDTSATVVSYRVIAAGSAVVETDFAGTEKEMLTLYHRDGDELVLTHYCGCGNQPRMRAQKSKDSNELIFDFDGGTNINPTKGMHMHDCRFRFVDANHFQTEWQMYVDGKPAGKHSFDLIRKQ
jgi:hypothetical protein